MYSACTRNTRKKSYFSVRVLSLSLSFWQKAEAQAGLAGTSSQEKKKERNEKRKSTERKEKEREQRKEKLEEKKLRHRWHHIVSNLHDEKF